MTEGNLSASQVLKALRDGPFPESAHAWLYEVRNGTGWQRRLRSRGSGSRGALNAGRLPAVGNDRGINGVAAPPALEWFEALAERLRRVRIVCGDWKRVLGPSVLGKGRNVGGRRPCAVFLDPPYDDELRASALYAEDSSHISADAREWAIRHGDDPDLRIVLAGLEGEHEMPSSWRCVAWRGARGYAGEGNNNRLRERLWLSPHCVQERQQSLAGLEIGHVASNS